MSEPHAAFVVVDASVWVSRLVTRDIFHEFVKEWMEPRGSDGMIFLSPALLLPEVAGAIARPTVDSRFARQARESLQSLTSLRIVEMDQSLVGDAARLAADLGLRGAVGAGGRPDLQQRRPDRPERAACR